MEKNRQSKSKWLNARRIACLVLAAWPLAAGAQQLEGKYRTNGTEVQGAFEPLRQVLQASSAVVYDGWKPFVYGVVVSEDGYILTKASELEDRKTLTVRVDDKNYEEVQVLGSDVEWDVALLKIDASGLEPVTWGDDEEVVHGTWIVSNGATSRTRRRARIGIISANAREVGAGVPVVLGVRLSADDEQIVIEEVTEGTGAEKAGVKKGDILVSAKGVELESREGLMELLKEMEPGDVLALTVERDGERLELEVELSARHKVFTAPATRNQKMSGRVSSRRTNFPRVLQHDIALSERSVGGPLLDLEGRCLGMNIARATRSETYAIPARELQLIFGELLDESR